ncbi:MAG TPA: lysoplasmalogenase [Candidatus Hydrogenedentes bacterium]|nr:lysoplasmalogenase [Candidatus Hydrogenedentota bacterium]HQM49757.1 lysoplasmalogenase [Candidatus Hydrogenedentota bacterium]
MEFQNAPRYSCPPAMPLAAGWPRSRLYCSLFTALTSLSVLAVLLSFRMEPVHPYRFGFLMIASACFLLVAVLGGALRSVYGRFIFTGLLCCALGDYVGFRNFVWGAIAFLVAHVFFVAAFWTLGVDWKRALRFLPFLLLVDAGILASLYPGIYGTDRPVAFAYIVFISAMVVFAFGVSAPQRRTLILAAATLFYFSDIFVARWRFTDTGSINGYFCYPIYYAACVLFAWTVCMRPDERPLVMYRVE